jgi:hypothetical protein
MEIDVARKGLIPCQQASSKPGWVARADTVARVRLHA